MFVADVKCSQATWQTVRESAVPKLLSPKHIRGECYVAKL